MVLYLPNRQQLIETGPQNNSCFIAHSHKREDWGDHLVSELKSQQVDCISPFQDEEQISFLNMVIKHTTQTKLFLADFTIPNFNVIFEYGLALGLGFPVLAFADISRPHGVPTLIDDVKQKRFRSRTQIISSVVENLTDPRITRSNGKELSPFKFGPWMLSSNIFDLVYYPLHRDGDEHNAIKVAIKKNTRGLRTEISPSYMRASLLENLLATISSSSINIFNYVHSEKENAEEINLNTSLLLGYSYGAGKATIVLIPEQDKYLHSDIRKHCICYTNESDLTKQLTECISNERELIINRRQSAEYYTIPQTEKLENKIRFTFGEPEADVDQLLFDSFEKWPETDKIVSGKYPIISGKKGTGKTALKRYLENIALDVDKTVILSIDPIDDDLIDLYYSPSNIRDYTLLPLLNGHAKTIWLELLTIYAVLSIDRDMLARIPRSTYASIIALQATIEAMVGNNTIIWHAANALNDSVQELSREHYDIKPSSRFRELSKQCKSILSKLRSQDIDTVIIFDSVEEGWHTRNVIPLAFISGLIQAIIQARKKAIFIPILMIREDLLNHIYRYVPEIDKGTPFELKWTRVMLRNCISRRIKSQLILKHARDRESYVNAIFEREGKISCLDFLLGKIALKPREAINYCNQCWRRAAMDERDRICIEDVEAEGKTMASRRLELLNVEYGYDMPWMSRFLDRVKGTDGRYTLKRWVGIISGLDSSMVRGDTGDRLSDSRSRVDQITLELLRCEVIIPSPRYAENVPVGIEGEEFERLLPSTIDVGNSSSVLSKMKFWGKRKEEIVYVVPEIYKAGLAREAE